MTAPRAGAPSWSDAGGGAHEALEAPASLERGPMGMPKPQGWTIERLVSLIAGATVLLSLGLGRRSARWRAVSVVVAVNLVLDATIGWCPVSLALHRLGILSAAERSIRGAHGPA